jgi:hypothetical protein
MGDTVRPMDAFTPTYLGQPPTDPAYLRFEQGLKLHVASAYEPQRWRWYPFDQNWYPFPNHTYGLEEDNLGTTPPPAGWAFALMTGEKPAFDESEIVALFQAIAAHYAGNRSRAPRAVWSGHTGDWRSFVYHGPVVVPPNSGSVLPPDVIKGIAKLREAERIGAITHDQAAKLIYDLMAENT